MNEINEKFKMPGGEFELKFYKDQKAFERGEFYDSCKVHNKMTNASLAVISGLVGNTGSQTAFTYLELGTSSTATSAAHTTLQAAITDTGLARASATVSRTTTTQTNDTLSLTKTWTASGAKTIEEIGVFNASSGGVMLCRALTGSKATANGNVVVATYTIQFVGN
jgi:hypothetical protein